VRRELSDRVIVITGASSGIGAATALACARAGMHAVLSGRDAARLEEVARRVRALRRTAHTVVGDVTEPDLNRRLLDTAEAALGRFDVVLANAGYGFKRPTHEVEDAELRRIFEVNFFAAVALLREAARRLLAAGRPGHLLMTSSAVAKFTLVDFGAYSATKAAQNHICRAMRMELRPFGIEVASIHPITTRTDFFRRAAEYGGVAPARSSPHGGGPRWFAQDPEQVAAAIVRCLRRPRPEVWTSFSTRLAAGWMTIFPRLMDVVGRRFRES
jgi:NAD(P)-dependent dehydrogenase (short-subunit alcohol dehydrogenase family)